MKTVAKLSSLSENRCCVLTRVQPQSYACVSGRRQKQKVVKAENP